jgi:hypothetical protein
MSETRRSALTKELVELFDIKKAKLREEKELSHEATEAQKDIRLLTLMFCDGIPDVTIKLGDNEMIKWDARAQKLLYVTKESTQVLEGTSKEVRIRIRPHLTELVKKAKEFYSDY